MSKLNVIKSIESARNYEELKLEIINFEADDVIRTSPDAGYEYPEGDWGGAN